MNDIMLKRCLLTGAFNTIMNSFSDLGASLRVKVLTSSLDIGFSIYQDYIILSLFAIVVPSSYSKGSSFL
jgi:hypothetical protein